MPDPTDPPRPDGQTPTAGGGVPTVPFAGLSAPAPLPLGPPGFAIDRELGRGGMGVVYLARQLGLNRPCALKMLLGGAYHGQAARMRFLIEAEAVAQLDHPHVVPVYEFGAHDGQPYLALEYVAGGTLDARVRRAGKLPGAEAAAVLAKLAAGIAHAHSRGVVHRDLKPSNVLLTPAGEPKVTDFGLAKVGTEPGVTASGELVGTPHYMAPEQASGDARVVGTAADVWALGAVLYAVLTGRPPFDGGSMAVTLHQVITEDPRRPRTLAPDVSRDLETICLKCLEKDPARRYPTADALRADLLAYLAGRPITARPVGPAERAWKWVKRNPGRAAVVAAGLAVLAAAGVAADRVARQREADRADALVRTVAAVDPAGLPWVLDVPPAVRARAAPGLRALAARPITTREGLHARLSLLGEEPALVTEVAGYLPVCQPEELLPIRDFLKPHAAEAASPLWSVLTDSGAEPGRRVRAAGGLAGLAADDPRWTAVAPTVAELAHRANPVEAAVLAGALEPVREWLVAPLLDRYAALARIADGDRVPAADVAAFDLTAGLLARYAHDRPRELAELAATADPRHHPLFAAAYAANRGAVEPLLVAELAKSSAGDSGTAAVAGAGLGWAAGSDATARRQANAAAVLLALGAAEPVWPLLRHSPDPTARSCLIDRLGRGGIDPSVLARRFAAEPDVSAKRALVLALGDFDPRTVPVRLGGDLLALYVDHPDAGLHSALRWLLKEKWGRAAEVAAADAELAKAADLGKSRNWFVTGDGQTFAVVRGERTVAVTVTEVTNSQFLRFRPGHVWNRQYSPDPDTPADDLTWYDAVAYCNWLSRRDGLPEAEWCYQPNPAGEYAEGMRAKPGHLKLTGYRLPTEAEWETAARAGADAPRFYGRGDRSLGRYGWFSGSSDDRTWPVGQLRPNDLGLFDVLGNVSEWVDDPADGSAEQSPVQTRTFRLIRGGAFNNRPLGVSSAVRYLIDRADLRNPMVGFRVARTLR